MKRLIIMGCIFLPLLTFGQSDGTFRVRKEKEKEVYYSEVFNIADLMPLFPGGQNALINFLAKNVSYPDSARINTISGTVYINFIIDTLGNVTNVNVIRGVHPLLDQEAVRVVKLMPRWSPGKLALENRLVNVNYNIPIRFLIK